MELWKNREVRLQLLAFLLADILFGAAAFFFHPAAGILTVISGVCYAGISWFFLRRRYAAIAHLGSQIDRILHGCEGIVIADCEEGELSILQSEIRKMTVRLREQADGLRQDKIRLSDAMADISHQLRTPLTSMNLTVSMLLRDDLTEEKRLELTRDLKNGLLRMDWLVESLLKMSRLDAGMVQFRSERVAADVLVRRACEPFLVPMELRGQTLRVTADSCALPCDAAWTAEALGNIIKNCMEHTPVGGTVSVTAVGTPLFVQIEISDTGDGVDPSDLPHLFERFYRGKNASSDSVGIGLALARAVISAQNGTVTAQNGKDGGAVFTVRFYYGIV